MKYIVIKMEDWDKFLENISTNKRFLLNITEIDTDQSIEERAEKYSEEMYDNDPIAIKDYISGATEQDLISKAREKEEADELKSFLYYLTNSLAKSNNKNGKHAIKFASWLMENCQLANDNSLWSYKGEDYSLEGIYKVFNQLTNQKQQ